MIPFALAYERMLGAAPLLPAERVPLAESAHRILAEDVSTDLDMPPFDKSAMDGYACRRADLPHPLSVVATIPAGCQPTITIHAQQCARIMTGAPVPPGADCVVMQEQTAPAGPELIRFTGQHTQNNICRRGEDLTCGDLVLRRGTRIGPAAIAVLASVGCTTPLVARAPRVFVAATGNELVPADRHPGGAQIRDSNSSQLCAQLRALGAIPHHAGIIPDAPDILHATIQQARQEHDLLLFSGGVSTGDFDFVPAALTQCGFELLFESVAMQPGKPMIFGRAADGVCCCGLPGNPVSTYVVFELLLRPFLLQMMGHTYHPIIVTARLAEPFQRRKTDRQTTIPVRFLTPDTVTPVAYHGSAHIHALCAAEALLTIPTGVAAIPQGAAVDVRLL